MLELLKWERTNVGGVIVYKAIVDDGIRKMRYVIRNWGCKGKSVELDVQKSAGELWESVAVYYFFTVTKAKEKAEIMGMKITWVKE